MDQSIASLSPEQAQHALMTFYDLLPDAFWESGKKPSAAKLKFTAEKLQEDATEDVRPVVNGLLAEGSEEGKGEVAKVVLGMFYDQGSLRGYVEQAIEQAKKPHLAPIPLIIGAVIVILAAVPEEIKKDADGSWRAKWPSREKLMNGLANFVSKLPAASLKALIGG